MIVKEIFAKEILANFILAIYDLNRKNFLPKFSQLQKKQVRSTSRYSNFTARKDKINERKYRK